MRKIPTLFKRDPEDRKHVLPEVVPGCAWVVRGEGRAQRKYDGTCCYIDEFGKLWARREVRKDKTPPADFRPLEKDPETGKTVGWVPVTDEAQWRWHNEGMAWLERYIIPARLCTYELVGPKVQGNPENASCHQLWPHHLAPVVHLPTPITFGTLREFMRTWPHEGLVWTSPTGRQAKLKVKDFAFEEDATS